MGQDKNEEIVHLRLPPGLKEDISREAIRQNINASVLMRNILSGHINQGTSNLNNKLIAFEIAVEKALGHGLDPAELARMAFRELES